MAITGSGTGIFNFTASGDILTTLVIMDSCRWVGASAAGHLCHVTDSAGNTLFRSEADGANFVDGWVFDKKWTNGVVMASMNSGTFQLYEVH